MRSTTKLGLLGLCVLATVSCASESSVGQPPAEAALDPVLTSCDNDGLRSGSCTAGACRLHSPSHPLPEGAVVGLTASNVPTALAADALGTTVCSVVWPSSDVPKDLTLAITVGAGIQDAILFEHRGTGDDASLDVTGQVDAAVLGQVRRSGTYGVTKKPSGWSTGGTLGTELAASSDGPKLLRNLSRDGMTSTFFDGTHLFVGNGPRVLVYEGIPNSPLQKPKIVLGQPDLDTTIGALSASLFASSSVVGLWSDGTRLVAVTGNRVLVWQQLPTENMTPADLVLGQADFSSNRTNGVDDASATSLSIPHAVTFDGTRLFVADSGNNRVVGWSSFPTESRTPADIVVGQADFKGTTASSGNFPLYIPYGVLSTPEGLFVSGYAGPLAFASNPFGVNVVVSHDVLPGDAYVRPDAVARPGGIAQLAGGGIAVREIDVRRIACTREVGTGRATIDYVLGQPDALRVVTPTYASSFQINPARVDASNLAATNPLSSSNGTLLVPDGRRLLVFDAPAYHYEPASRVIGQPGFTVNERADYRTVNAGTLASPAGIATRDGIMAVADKSNNRVLVWRPEDLGSANQPASVIVGQPDGTSFVANGDIVSASASTLSGPEGVALDGAHLIVADTQNHRVLVWNGVPQSAGRPADIVLGQSDFSGRRPNHGRGDVSPQDGFSDAAADGFFYPTDVASDGTHLFVADRLNHRVLVWDTFPTSSGQPASRVIGQPSMTTVAANHGGGPFAVSPEGLNLPSGLSLDGSTLWIADTENNRVVRWDNATSTSASPSAWLGQPDGATIAASTYERSGPFQGSTLFQSSTPTDATTVLRPRKVVVAAGKIFVSELDANRIHVFDGASLASSGVVGQANPTSSAPNAEGVSASTLAEPMGMASDGTQLWVADARNHRVLGYPLASVTSTSFGASATRLIGQSSMFAAGFNQSSVAAEGATSQPRAISLSGDRAFVADSGNHRILEEELSGASFTVKRVYGQPDDSLALANSGVSPSARTMNGPRGVWSDASRLVVADTGNHRIMIFDRTSSSPDAAVVLGQPTFSSVAPNAGGVGLATLRQPGGVCSDGIRLFGVDTANHRVLVWSQLPTTSGVPADIVLGQSSGTDLAANGGSSVASSRTMAFPSACVVRGDSLFVADTGNNRVLSFDLNALSTSAPALAVWGQPSDTSRIPASNAFDDIHLAGPSALAADSHNLYVADRDLGRVIVFGARGQVTTLIGGIGSASSLRAGDGIAASPTGAFSTRLFVSETGADRIGIVESVSRLQPR